MAMPEHSGELYRTPAPLPRRRWVDPWSAGAVAIAALVLMPVLAVIWLALFPTVNFWPYLLSTTLPRYLSDMVLLMLAVGAVDVAAGIGAAWLVVLYRFPGRGWLQWALLLPLAVPAYVGAYALVDLNTPARYRPRCAPPLAGRIRATTGSPASAARRLPLSFWLPHFIHESTFWPARPFASSRPRQPRSPAR